jgi:steroid 5-alpha reductase family enzyme
MDLSLLLHIVLLSLAACSLVMAGVWIWAWKIKNAGVVDIFWSFNFPLIALILLLTGNAPAKRLFLICGMVLIWGARLGIYLLIRVGSHLQEEEGRYKQLRTDWAPYSNAKFFAFFQMQAFSNVFLAIPFFLISLNTAAQLQFNEYVALGLWCLALLGEAFSDAQLKRFKSNNANKGKVCNVGLWKYSRHPNYFFEWVIWLSYFLFALSAHWGAISVICPAVILFLLFKVTGIPMTEEQSLRTRGDAYREYQRTTSVFVPWFQKR